MSIKTLVVAFLALLCGGSAALMVVLLNGKGAAASVATETVPVVVATVDVGRGISVSAEMVTLKQWPKESVPVGTCTSLDEVIGKSSRSSLVRDEPFLKSRLSEGSGLNALIPLGMRAYTIQTPSVSAGVGGFIQPEDRVDVILTVTSAGGGDERITGGGIATILLQNVQVLAAGKSLHAEAEDTKLEGRQLTSVTLLVTPRQSQELTLAQTKGTLNLALRREGDADGEDNSPLYLSDLAFIRETANTEEAEAAAEEKKETAPVVVAPPVAPPRPSASQIRLIRGISRENLMIQRGVVLPEPIPSEVESAATPVSVDAPADPLERS